ncbi:hypothetical protein VTK56DRAFT_6753 [Thermocarpiscus australiensis]
MWDFNSRNLLGKPSRYFNSFKPDLADWKPPKFGSPVWLGITATDTARAEKFYSTVFNWKFKDTGKEAENKQAKSDETRLFDFNPDVFLTGASMSRTRQRLFPQDVAVSAFTGWSRTWRRLVA